MRKMTGTDFDNLVEYFDAMAQTNWLAAVHDQLKNLSGSWNNKKILDIGCGTGRLLERGKGEAIQLIGVDLSKEMIEKSKDLFAHQTDSTESLFEVADAYDLPLSANYVDVAISTCVMFLLPEPEKGLAEMRRVVKVGGVISMLNPSPKMSPETADQYAKKHDLSGFESESLLMWSNVSTKRHRYSNTDLNHVLTSLGMSKIQHTAVLDGLATITVAVK
ncbi:class I SAM-dependent methyltransferase [Halalkalibacter alkalisediminis]|uniref:Class I SAM-dependent methyltransferase n=1 Tax=Halalkalibacter alkalisediminis TaxID=935616 RepID=A0ABV6NEH8_9BACI|nr:class I SAM-dependent methyltransferase [Halalkalibacter alkalisediminis]